MNLIHLDVDRNLAPYLKQDIYSFPLNKENLGKIKNKDRIEAISFKSQSDTLDKEVISSFPKLKLLLTRTVGIDHINLELCEKKGIAVYNIPDYGAYNIAEHAAALLLAGGKNIINAHAATHAGKFSYESFLGTSIRGKILGIIGTGKIGLELAGILKSFRPEIIAYDIVQNAKAAQEIGFRYVALTDLLKASDFISLHVPLLPQTYHMISDKELKLMKDGSILVNTSRGAAIDTRALIRHIGKFKAICLDVLEDEKNFSRNNPLLKYENVLITPHCAFYSDASVKKIAEVTLENFKRFQKGDPTNKVTIKAG